MHEGPHQSNRKRAYPISKESVAESMQVHVKDIVQQFRGARGNRGG